MSESVVMATIPALAEDPDPGCDTTARMAGPSHGPGLEGPCDFERIADPATLSREPGSPRCDACREPIRGATWNGYHLSLCRECGEAARIAMVRMIRKERRR